MPAFSKFLMAAVVPAAMVPVAETYSPDGNRKDYAALSPDEDNIREVDVVSKGSFIQEGKVMVVDAKGEVEVMAVDDKGELVEVMAVDDKGELVEAKGELEETKKGKAADEDLESEVESTFQDPYKEDVMNMDRNRDGLVSFTEYQARKKNKVAPATLAAAERDEIRGGKRAAETRPKGASSPLCLPLGAGETYVGEKCSIKKKIACENQYVMSGRWNKQRLRCRTRSILMVKFCGKDDSSLCNLTQSCEGMNNTNTRGPRRCEGLNLTQDESKCEDFFADSILGIRHPCRQRQGEKGCVAFGEMDCHFKVGNRWGY